VKQLCHLTILDPLRHPRLYHKLARSQARLGYRVSVWGQGHGRVQRDDLGIRLRPTGKFGRMSLRRWLAPFWLAWLARRSGADAYVLHRPELLLTGWWLKRRTGALLLYDVHEDYAANLRHGAHWPAWLRRPLARSFRAWERWAVRRWVDGVCYAEACYDNFLGVPPERRVVLENAFVPPAERKGPNERVGIGHRAPLVPTHAPYLLYSGTIAVAWGLWEAIDLWQQWQAIEPMHLVVAGHTHQAAVLAELQRRVEASGYRARFTLVGGSEYVPHEQIVELLRHSQASLALYHPLPQTRGKFPTKFFEAMACGRPAIFWPLPEWIERNRQTPFGLPWQPGASVTALIEALQHWQAPSLSPKAYAWSAQESKLKTWLSNLGLLTGIEDPRED